MSRRAGDERRLEEIGEPSSGLLEVDAGEHADLVEDSARIAELDQLAWNLPPPRVTVGGVAQVERDWRLGFDEGDAA